MNSKFFVILIIVQIFSSNTYSMDIENSVCVVGDSSRTLFIPINNGRIIKYRPMKNNKVEILILKPDNSYDQITKLDSFEGFDQDTFNRCLQLHNMLPNKTE